MERGSDLTKKCRHAILLLTVVLLAQKWEGQRKRQMPNYSNGRKKKNSPLIKRGKKKGGRPGGRNTKSKLSAAKSKALMQKVKPRLKKCSVA